MSNEVNEKIYCIGCGAEIQTDDPKASGYVPPSTLENRDEGDLYCKRCFRLRHYNEVADVELTSDDFLNMLGEIGDQDALVVNLVDILDFNGSVVPSIERFAGSNPVMVVGNKVDLLPKSLKKPKLKQWLTERVHEMGVRPLAVELISAVKPDSVEEFLDLIEKHRGNRDVYIVGTTNVGKSTLINQLIHLSTQEKNLITTSYFPGTTLGKIEIPLDDGHVLVDTPGIFQEGQLVHQLTNKELKLVMPKKELKPRNYQLNPEQTLFLGGLGRLDYLSGQEKASFVVYAANTLDIHRTKLEKADDLYDKQAGKTLTPPLKDSQVPDLQKQTFNIKEPSDIVFSGLGWIKVNASNVKVTAHYPKGADIFIRKPMI